MKSNTTKAATPRKTGERPGPEWFTRDELKSIFACSLLQVDRRFTKLAPPDAVARDGNRVWYHARRLIDALIADELAKARPADPDVDPLLAGGDSPNLERYRAARADLAEMEAAERRKTHLSIGDIDRELVRFASSIRRAGEVLQRRWGNDASDVLNEAIDGALAAWQGRTK